MKKWIIIVLVLAVLFLVYVYVLIPGHTDFHRQRAFAGNARIIERMVMNIRSPFWKGGADGREPEGKGFSYHGHHYEVIDQQLASVTISIDGESTELTFISPQIDSSALNWHVRMSLPVSPFVRLDAHAYAGRLKADIDSLLAQMQEYDQQPERTYGRRIIEDKVRDSILLSTYGRTTGYPTLPYIYSLIGQVRDYAKAQSAQVTGQPMLNINTEDSVNWLTRVALPVDKRLPPSGTISFKWMLGGGNILVTDVTGGPAAIHQAFIELENYVHDHDRTAPAIPFESLTTNRLEEKDTSKWQTRIYYPVM